MPLEAVHALMIHLRIGTHSLYPRVIRLLTKQDHVDMFSVIFSTLKFIKKVHAMSFASNER